MRCGFELRPYSCSADLNSGSSPEQSRFFVKPTGTFVEQRDQILLRKPRQRLKMTLPNGLAWQVRTRILRAGIEFGTSRYNQNTIATISQVHNLARVLRRASFTRILENFTDLQHTILSLMQNEWQIGGKWSILILEAPAASGISLDLPLEFCNSRQLFGAFRMQWAPSGSKVLHSRAIFAPFKRVTIQADHAVSATKKS